MKEVEICIRQAQASDAEEILNFSKRVGSQTEHLTYGPEGIPYASTYLAANLEALRESSCQFWLVAVEDSPEGRVIGQVTVGSVLERHIEHIGEIGVVVDQDYWGQGLGRLLMEEALTWFHEFSPLYRLELRVLSSNRPAISLYQSLGFQIEGKAKAVSRKLSGEYVDGYYMAYVKGQEK
ncbi:GNAT family N-acetyltransferase [Atopobacter sp. AH10]|uniref:GNAT family N-acetyltransferase n=1 Tax=Atopobacter sp. AH10 TaxID=2315861 RepID=UPI000EF28C29|nr:GNAT family N-acetyltransferase [Atopobacter sp. AH10]RLK63887.1 GNAT family N-acetyltransferase [Atopobacter sp. AH10]